MSSTEAEAGQSTTGNTQDATGHGNFKFVVLERPADAKSRGYRKQVRSYITTEQHRRARQDAANLSTRSRKFIPSAGDDGRKHAVKKRKQTKRQKTEKPEPQEDQRKPNPINAKALPSFQNAVVPGSPVWKSFSDGTAAFQAFALDDPLNIVGRGLKRLKLDVSSVLKFYAGIVALQAADFESHFARENSVIKSGEAYGRFLSFIGRDPVVLTTSILLTTQHLLSPLGAPLRETESYYILQLEGHLIRSINAALDDPIRSISNELIVAVTLLAAYELKRGSLQGYHLHMGAIVQMCKQRGGLAEIGLADPYLERLIIWQDANCAQIAGCQSYCKAIGQSSMVSPPKPDEAMFRATKVLSYDSSKMAPTMLRESTPAEPSATAPDTS
ncbi:uncharacterized protein LTR77_005903 [Saxophila tyrrhenica]|uniref:Uncharacterized protein n=1 Tax=Saxophila tyrrhenica TaxID=1690608 RepID=A0AAV9PDW5_9PEZI|nr:hypothetical protein LTR77_005903 [Saxophila tyrrhenica]